MGDDIGQTNVSAYSFGVMGYRTPNIDRLANEGMMFTDYYAEQSCTAGRVVHHRAGDAAHRPFQGRPARRRSRPAGRGHDHRRSLKPLGYATGQFGKNHLGDKNEFLPTVHGFDEFFGNLYHLNAEEEPENPDYPKDPVSRSVWAAGRAQVQCDRPRRPDRRSALRRVGKQTIEDTGALTKKRMETIDDEISALPSTSSSASAGQHAVLLLVQFDPHARHHACAAIDAGPKRLSEYFDGMIEHDGHVGQILKALDDLGIANDTIVLFNRQRSAHEYVAGRRLYAVPQ